MLKNPETKYNFTAWAKIRLEEMSLTLDAFNFKIREPKAENSSKSATALDRVYNKFSDFEKTLFREKPEKRTDAIRAWNELETVLEAFSVLTMSEKESFEIRAIAQRRAWQKTIDSFAAATAQASGERQKILEKALTKLNQKKDAATSRLDIFNKAGSRSWRAMNQVLNDSREVFEKAVQKAQEDFSKAGD